MGIADLCRYQPNRRSVPYREDLNDGRSRTPKDRPVALTDVDRNLLKRCLAEKPGAWRDFVDRYIGLFIHVVNHTAHARSVKLRQEDLDDLCAEVFVALLADNYAILRRFRGRSSLATYLTVISRRIVVRQMSKRRMAEQLGHVESGQTALEQAKSIRNEFQRIEDREEVNEMLSDLPPRDAKIVRAFHIEGKSYREISDGLKVPENSIGPTLSRALKRLRQRNVQT